MTARTIFKTLGGAALLLSSAASFAFGGAPASAEIDNTAIGNHQQTWEYKALAKQNLLDNAVPLSQGFQVMGHNAYNSTAYSSIVHIDPNHNLSMTELLDLGVRTLEMDYHWVHQTKDIPHGGALLMCHAGDDDFGCSGLERYLHQGVEEVNSWLRKNPKEVLVLYFQDDAEGHDTELKNSVSSIDDLIYKQPAGQCKNFSEMVKTVSEEDVLNAGKQVIIMGSSCANRGAWTGYSWNSIHNYVSGGGQTIKDRSEADCLADTAKQDGAHRIWEDATNLSAAFGDPGPAIDAALAAKAGRCGIGALSLDKIFIGDSRLKASVWSWAENEPSGGDSQDCGFVRDNGRYYDGNCSGEGSYYTCSSGPTSWKVTTAYGDWSANADSKCKAEFGSDYSFSIPTNSQQNQWLKVAMGDKPHAWVNYTDSAREGIWLTPKHTVDYGDGTAKLSALQAGLMYDFYMKATHNGCELQWQGGDEGTGERNAKFDCVSKGDLMKFFPDAPAQTAADGTVSIHGVIKTEAGGHLCGLEWDGGISGGERNAKFDCSGSADPVTIISKSNGTTERVIIKSDNNCGLQWDGSIDGDNERNAKFDCDPAYDDMTLYGVKLPKLYREIKVMGKCLENGASGNSGADVFVWDCNGADHQKWVYEDSTGFVRNKRNNNMCLDTRGKTEQGHFVGQWECVDHQNLKWDRVGNMLRPRIAPNLALDLQWGTPNNGQKSWLWPADNGAAQNFTWGSY